MASLAVWKEPQAAQEPLKAPQPEPFEQVGVEVLTALKFAPWPLPPAVQERRPPAPASTASGHSHDGSSDSEDGEGVEHCPTMRPSHSPRCASSSGGSDAAEQRLGTRRARSVGDSEDGEVEGGWKYRPRKVRVLSTDGPTVLQRRSYTWRGISSRRAEKQQRQLDALAAEQQAVAAAAAGASPAHSSGNAGNAPTAAGASTSSKEGDRDWAALTTWLRMNIHNPRTSKKVVLFVGQRDAASGRWAFRLNPALTWSDISAETRHRLQHLPAEAAQAFARKYPNRPPGDWRVKSQKYKPLKSSQTHLVLVEELVSGLHCVWQQHECGGEVAADVAAAASHGAATSAAAAAAPPQELASCGSSALQLGVAP